MSLAFCSHDLICASIIWLLDSAGKQKERRDVFKQNVGFFAEIKILA